MNRYIVSIKADSEAQASDLAGALAKHSLLCRVIEGTGKRTVTVEMTHENYARVAPTIAFADFEPETYFDLL